MAVKFEPFVATESYKCGIFLQDSVNDEAMYMYYGWINYFIKLLSKPFPHQDLLSQQALNGDQQAWMDSFAHKYPMWLQHEQWWIVLALSCVIVSAIFTVVYALYRCCLRCCRRGRKARTTEKQYDGCKRTLFNFLIGALIVMNVFFAVALFISTQYNEIGIEQLPTRINNCIDDLNVYKRDTDLRIRKLLIEDVQKLNESLSTQIREAGTSVVKKVKASSGASIIDTILQKYLKARLAHDKLIKIRREIAVAKDQIARYPAELSRLKNSVMPDLESCVENNIDPKRTFCMKTLELFNSIDAFPLDLEFELITQENEAALNTIMSMDIISIFDFAEQAFRHLENDIVRKIEGKAALSLDAVKQIGDKLFSIAADISTQIRQVNFDVLYEPMSRLRDEQSTYQKYAKYSWYASLIIAGLFAFIALTFLFGLFYGCCGRRPSYYNDDCCIRSTGSRFFRCGIWMSLSLLTVLTIVAAGLMLVGANISNLVCHPLEDPLSRPDVLSLAERMVDLYGKHSRHSDFDIFNDNRTLTDVIRGCNRNDTFYQMFGLDAKYKLSKLKEVYREQFNAAVEELRDLIKVITPVDQKFQLDIDFKTLANSPSVNVSKINPRIMQQLQDQINAIDVAPRLNGYNEMTKNAQLPAEVAQALDNLNEFQLSTTQPLSHSLDEIMQDLLQLNDHFDFGSFSPADAVPGLQHARALLEVDFKGQMEVAAGEVIKSLANELDDYIQHVDNAVSTDVTSCTPVKEILRNSRAALCAHMVYPLNGVWMSMLISLLLMILVIMLSTSLIKLYNQMHAFPKYTVHEPSTDNLCSLATDTYGAARAKPMPYAMTYGYQEPYPPPYLGVRQIR
uniref:Prominin-like protein n=1 Tax=Panagrellus redivivus TaxID=6233 RepID=A0A7E4W0C3_PANRE